jgi:HEAT repeat protein
MLLRALSVLLITILLASCDHQANIDRCILQLQSGDKEQQNQAARQLIKYKDKSVPALSALLKSDDETQPLMALTVLAKINTSQAAAAALPALHDERPDVRYEAAKLVAAAPLPAQTCALCTGCVRDPYWKVRLEMTKLMARCNSREAATALALLLQDTEPAIRSAAIQNLLGMKLAYATDAILQSMDNTDEQVRYIAIQAIGNLGDKRAIPRLLQTLQADRNTYLRQKAAVALAQLGAQEAAPLLQEMLANGTAAEQKAAKEALGVLASFR